MDEIERETEEKTKIKHWREMKTDVKVGKRPQYMEKLTRKQCNALLKARASMLPVKNNFKNGCKKDTQCRYCKTEVETQEHILQKCPEVERKVGHIIYNRIFQEEVEELEKTANFIMKVEEELSKAEVNLNQKTKQ